MNIHNTESYTAAFRAFQHSTDEKERLAEEIRASLALHKFKSLLDIGAGDGELAKMIAPAVGSYTALESNAEHVKRLRKLGFRVLADTFPTKIANAYDFVLCSHSLPYNADDAHVFIREAWKLVNSKGQLCIVTYRDGGAESVWRNFCEACGLSDDRDYEGRFPKLKHDMHHLREYASLMVTPVTTHVQSKHIEKMLSALSFVYAEGQAEWLKPWNESRDAIKAELNRNYFREGHYSMPFENIFLVASKR
jgi:SAM-dependent methyltransferase